MPFWNGSTTEAGASERHAAARAELSTACRSGDWDTVFSCLRRGGLGVNSWHLDDRSLLTPLHEAAGQGANAGVIERLIERGAWRSLPTRRGERAVDIAARCGWRELVPLLEPAFHFAVPAEAIERIQTHLHSLIRERASALIDRSALRLPEVSVLLEMNPSEISFPVPGMYGEFRLQFRIENDVPGLEVTSWCRVVMGSGQRHHVTVDGCTLVEEGFV